MEWSKEEINALYEKVMAKAATDSDFRKELLEDSTAAIEKVAGKKLPDGFKVKVIEKDPAYAETFVLPDMITGELDENSLDAVAGGACFVDACAGNACAAEAGVK
ncbi:MAG TPA: NHLP leader peptide family RiPP precursor [Lachnospiraceae bacterium]|nr:NHLP leader peptide family RiPP precursor [Lachnospiraceae bacterium]